MAAKVAPRAPFRVCIDINIWISSLRATLRGRSGTATQAITALANSGVIGTSEIQLIMSAEMISTAEAVLLRVGYPEEIADELGSAIGRLMKAGPEHLDPVLLLSGRDQLRMHDREDAGVLATAISARVNLLVTDNLKDFETNDSASIRTQRLSSPQGERELFCIIHERQDDVALIVAHPIDVLTWIRDGLILTPAGIRSHYSAHRP